jgi:putative ATP-dependent endonuclease of OLD family
MFISRVVIRNFRNFQQLDVTLGDGVTSVVGEDNTGKSNFIFALRLALDAGLSSTYRVLDVQDFHCATSISRPEQVLVSVEFSDYAASDAAAALVGCWESDPDRRVARLTYRFRPRRALVEMHEQGEEIPENLTLDDYHWEVCGGGQVDPSVASWHEQLGNSVRFSDLQQFQVVSLPALRDVRQDLRQSRISPLGRLLDSSAIPEHEKEALVDILRDANDAISAKESIAETGVAIDRGFKATAGEAFEMNIRLGMADPSFSSIARSLTLLLSNDAIADFEPSRNGLGLNNILYISMLMEAFERLVQSETCAGQLLLVEEPEAHLHPQLQRVLFARLKQKPFQTILSSHSTHITSLAELTSIVLFTNDGYPATKATTPCRQGELQHSEVMDLQRHLDATRSTLLYARKVILVEGPAEFFLIPPLVKQVTDVDLERHGVSVVPIHGVHFDVYAKLFNEMGMPKKCAIIADGDLLPSDAIPDSDEPISLPELDAFRGKFVEVFRCETTFERAITLQGNLQMLAEAARELGAQLVGETLENGLQELNSEQLAPQTREELLANLQTKVLNTAKRFGKARFAQVASKHMGASNALPGYISEAIEWLEL